ncbi:LysR family transcriptional regulator [Staphylococcus epidermidis]|jgi:DNA-binding transcriptional LysR family regulator|uniref:Transcriptional regulator, LysR family n=11 Tax=root TaxID=1 RepID=Q5HL30_STAEQ|nr:MULTISPECIES: LysR family transcriptional regulator [Staphylococcus]EHQ73204.1 LysR substrate binding domain protein [Staphylococcus epidermidis VCU057]EHR89830.1 LysR substrate binding domain protein [Staphylococcus epidermidis VCU123]EID35937.1 LysR substrate binding domain protein [Staphylococcus epidermidis IS-250]EJD77272.1 transcriptional regulator, LysR family [Staphylococcus epidermidis NIHLM088]EJD89166.1 transcriptional regulator, LysR family [Staphylococcus epidermidis NIHLM070]
MEIKQIKYFVEVVRQGGMTQASEHLYIAQSTISKAIKNIENEYDITLFDRSQKQIKLTDIGQTFYDNSLEFLALFEKLSLEMNDIVNVQKGHIKIGLSPMMNVQMFTNALNQFHRLYPNVTYEVIEGGGKIVENLTSNDDVDIGITTLPVDHTEFHSTSLYNEELLLVVSNDHHLAHLNKVDMADLKDEEFVLFHDDYYLKDQIIENCKRLGYYPKTVANISQISFIANMIQQGIGISIVPESLVNLMGNNVTSIQLENVELSWHLGVIWRKDAYLNHVTRKWIEFISEMKPT